MESSSARVEDVLASQVARLGDRPLLTYYDEGTGERTELGYATFGNWAAKSANLLADRDVEPGDDVVVAVDGHWTAVVVAVACGLVGARAVVSTGGCAAPAALVIAHERLAGAFGRDAPLLLVGEGLGGGLKDADADAFVTEALASDDDYHDPDVAAEDPWLVLPDGSVRTQEAVLAHGPDLSGDRVLATVPAEAALPFAVAALARGKSIVLARGGDAASLDRMEAAERCDARVP